VQLSRLFDRVAENEDSRTELFAYGSGYLLYRIVDEAVDAGFPMLRQMGSKLEDIEDELFEGGARELVRDISSAKSEIINFRRIVRPQRVVYRDLERAVSRYRAPDLDLYFDDITDASERIWDVLENYKEQVESIESTNESVIGHRGNDVLRVLTIFSVLLLPLTFVASAWGMNVKVPFADAEYGFEIVAAIMIGVLVATLLAFRRRGLL
jgi:magnesium transporter